MKDSKTILLRYLLLAAALQVAVILFLALQPLEHIRATVADAIRLPAHTLWIPLLVLLVGSDLLILRRLDRLLAKPFQQLVRQTKHGNSNFAFKTRSMNLEEDHLKHFVESLSLRHGEMEQELVRMETELDKAVATSKVSPEQLDQLNAKLEKAGQDSEELLRQIAELEKAKSAVERELGTTRSNLRLRSQELTELQNATMGRSSGTSQDASPSSILIEKLRNPLALISNLAWRLAKSWDETPMAQVREGLEEISKQSQEQLELLKKYQNLSHDANEPKQDAQ